MKNTSKKPQVSVLKKIETKGRFLSLLASDIDYGNIKPIPQEVIDRVTAIKHKARVVKQSATAKHLNKKPLGHHFPDCGGVAKGWMFCSVITN